MGTRNEPIQCTKCFTINPEDSEYCTRCGYSLEEKEKTISYPPDKMISRVDKSQFNPGENFGDRYKIIEEIGKGGMGRVYKATDKELNISVAIKVIHPKYSSNRNFISRFKKETLLARSISHDNVIRIHDIGDIEGVKYISMDYIDGENLKELIRTSGKFSVETAINITLQICEALKAAHTKGIIHRDLKPHNIMVDKSGRAYTMDFGLAKAKTAQDFLVPGTVYGTPQYTSPEQAKSEEADERSDIYAVGVILYEMLAGRSLFDANTKNEYLQKHINDIPISPSKFNPGIWPKLESVILKCLDKNREKRYQNIDALLKELSDCTIAYKTTSPLIGRWKWIAVTAVLIICGIFVAKFLFKQTPPPALLDDRISIAVLNFENNTGDDSLNHLCRTIPSLITYDLLQSKYIRPLTADKLIELHRKFDLSDISSYSRDDLKKIATSGSVGHILVGHIYRLPNHFRINTVIYDVRTWEPIGSPLIEGEDIYAMVDNLTKKTKALFPISNTEIAADIDEQVGKITTESEKALEYYIESLNLSDEGKYEKSIEILNKAVELDPKFAMAYKQISANHLMLGQIEQAKKAFNMAVANIAQVSLREKYLIQGLQTNVFGQSPKKAIPFYVELLKIYPDDLEGNTYLGSIYRNFEEWELAKEKFERALNTDRQNLHSFMNLLFINQALGRHKEGEELIEKNPHFLNNSHIQRLISFFFLTAKNLERAHSHAEKAISLNPKDSENIRNQGNIYHLEGQLELAQRCYKKLLGSKDVSSQFAGRFWMAHLHFLKGEIEKCKAEVYSGLKQARTQPNLSWEIQLLLLDSYINIRMQKFESALESAIIAREKTKETIAVRQTQMALLYAGLAALNMRDLEKANRFTEQLKDYIETSGIRAHRRFYLLLRGMILSQTGQILQAIDFFEIAISQLPAQFTPIDEHALFYDALAGAEAKRGNDDRAIENYEKIAAMTSGRLIWDDIYVKSFFNLGKLFQKRGMKKQSKENYDRFLRLWEKADSHQEEVAYAKKQVSLLTN